jgi:hypothetical protein
MSAPSIEKVTEAIPTELEAVAFKVTIPDTMALLAGAVMDTVGGAVEVVTGRYVA